MDTMEMRRNAIAELVNKHGTVSFSQIKEQFPQVSEMTLRTDLKALDAAKEIVRIHGGAKSVQLVIGTDPACGTQHTVQAGDCKKSSAAGSSGYRDFSGFRKHHHRTGTDFPGSVQSDLYHRTLLCHRTCKSHKTGHHAARWTAESLQHQYVRYLSHPGTGAGELSSDIFRGNRVFDESRVYLWKQ